MVQGERLSAVAKRRRLNGAAPIETTTVTTQLATNLAPSFPARSKAKTVAEPDVVPNSFDGLVEHDLVSFHSVRSIASVGEKKVKVSFSKGQECLVCGRFLLWVRHGQIALLGAVLHPATPFQLVYHPEDEDIPAIVCISEEADFQLESDNEPTIWTTPRVPAMYQWIIPGEERTQTLSFVLDGMEASIRATKQSPKEYRFTACNLKPLKRIVESLENTLPGTDRSEAILLCGKRHSGITKVSDGVVNHLLTTLSRLGHSVTGQGVLLLDINFFNPAFSPPGTASLTLVKKPILLPPYSRSMHSDKINQSLAIQFFDNATSAIEMQSKFQHLFDRLSEARRTYPDADIVINGWDFLDYCPHAYVENLPKVVALTAVVCFGDDSTLGSRYGQMLANSAKIPFHSVPFSASTMPTWSDLRKAALRSYLGQLGNSRVHSRGSTTGTSSPLQVIELCYGPLSEDAQVGAFHVPGEAVGSGEVVLRLLGSRVAILLMPAEYSPRQMDVEKASMAFVSSTHQVSGQLTVHRQRNGDTEVIVGRTQADGIPLIHSWHTIPNPIMADNECIGLGIIVHVNVSDGVVQLSTPVPQEAFRSCLTRGRKFLIVASKD